MKKTEEHGKITNIPEEDLQEIKRIVSGRKFCKIGRRLQDIVNEELARYEYENNAGFFTKIFNHHKFKKKKEQLILESCVYSIIRKTIVECIDEMRKDEQYVPIKSEDLIIKIKEKML